MIDEELNMQTPQGLEEVPSIEGEEEYGQSYDGELPPTPPPPERDPNQSPNYFEFFTNLFIEVYDIQSGFEQATESYTKVLLERGLEINPQELYSQVQLLAKRYTKFAMVKRLAHGMGLSGEVDRILEHEMNIVYNGGGRSPEKSQQNVTVVSGESDQ